MADNNLYLDSLKSLSGALEKGGALLGKRKQIKDAYVRVPLDYGNDPKTMVDALFDALPHISKLQEEERELKRSYVDSINKALNYIIDYISSIKKEDFSEMKITNFQKYLQTLIDVITSSTSILDGESYSIDVVKARDAKQQIGSFSGIPQADNVINKVNKLYELIGLSYVG